MSISELAVWLKRNNANCYVEFMNGRYCAIVCQNDDEKTAGKAFGDRLEDAILKAQEDSKFA